MGRSVCQMDSVIKFTSTIEKKTINNYYELKKRIYNCPSKFNVLFLDNIPDIKMVKITFPLYKPDLCCSTVRSKPLTTTLHKLEIYLKI